MIEFTIAYVKAFRQASTQLNRISIARRWVELEYRHPVTGETVRGVEALAAARWANKGYFPEEARRHLEAGRTPEQASAYDAAELDKFVGDARAFEALRV